MYGLRIRPKFTITQDLGSIASLEMIKEYFGCGNIYINSNTHSAELVVDSIDHLVEKIIPHFEKYPLHLEKQRSFKIMVSVVNILVNKEHYDKLVFAKMLKLIIAMNTASNRSPSKVQEYFDILEVANNNIPVELPEIVDHPLDENFLIGLIDGDGCFSVSFKANKELQLGFHISGHVSSEELFLKIRDTFMSTVELLNIKMKLK